MDDDDHTVAGPVLSGASRESVASSSTWGHTLPDGLRLDEFEIKGLIGQGGFGIVYLAYDHSLRRRVALKEYMPASLAARSASGLTVVVKADRHVDAFQAGLRSFVNEAQLLAQFDHPALVKVHRFWEAHGTAYMVMPYYEGPTLKSVLRQMSEPPDEATIRAWLSPLLDALAVLHAGHCYHRDIAPDNILLTAGGPLLLDFGAARRVIGDMTHALTVVLKPGYAPIEQYGELPEMAQGPWTDLYALGCVVYRAASGKVPMASVERVLADRLVPLSRLAAGRYSAGFLKAIDAALVVRPQDRLQSVASFRALLDATAAASPSPPPRAHEVASARPRRVSSPVAAATLAALAALVAGGWWIAKPRPTSAPPPAPTAATTAVQAPAPTRTLGAEAPPSAAAAPMPSIAPMDALIEREPPAAGIPPAAGVRPAASAVSAASVPPVAESSREKVAPVKRTTRTAALPPNVKSRAPARCSDILQKGSLEPLTAEETDFLRKECR